MFKDRIVREVTQPRLSTMTSPVLFRLKELLTLKGRARVLNLGSHQGNVEALFNSSQSEVDYCDLFTELKDEVCHKHESATAFINRLRRTCRELIPAPKKKAYDLVLCWDGFNYLSQDVFTFLSRYLVNFIHPDTLLHMYFHLHSTMPETPGQFELQANGLQVCYPDDELVTSPAYTQADLSRYMPRYSVVRSMLLKSGLQEYLMKVGPL